MHDMKVLSLKHLFNLLLKMAEKVISVLFKLSLPTIKICIIVNKLGFIRHIYIYIYNITRKRLQTQNNYFRQHIHYTTDVKQPTIFDQKLC